MVKSYNFAYRNIFIQEKQINSIVTESWFLMVISIRLARRSRYVQSSGLAFGYSVHVRVALSNSP